MTLLQLAELIPVETPLGNGYAMIIDFNAHDNYWTIALSNGAIVTFKQDKIRMCKSYTHERMIDNNKMRKIIK